MRMYFNAYVLSLAAKLQICIPQHWLTAVAEDLMFMRAIGSLWKSASWKANTIDILWVVSPSKSPSKTDPSAPCFVQKPGLSQGSHARATSHTFVAGETTEVAILTSKKVGDPGTRCFPWQIFRFGSHRTFAQQRWVSGVFIYLWYSRNLGKETAIKKACEIHGNPSMYSTRCTSQIWETWKVLKSHTSWDSRGTPRCSCHGKSQGLAPKGHHKGDLGRSGPEADG